MLGLCLVEVSPHPQGMPLSSSRMDQAFQDKLDGKISKDFWMRKSGECRQRKTSLLTESQST
jgi:hypothetical protein